VSQLDVAVLIVTSVSSSRNSNTAARPRRGVSFARIERPLIGVLAVGAFLAAWQIVGSREIIRSDLISYPSEIVATFIEMSRSGELGANVVVTLIEFVEGFIPACLFGIAAGLALALSRRLRYLVAPLFAALYSAPMIAFVPVIVVWFGVGRDSKIAMVFLAAVIPIIINTVAGVNEVSEAWIRAVRAFGAGRRQIIAKAILPGAFPAVMAGIRLGIGRSIVSLVAAEMYVSIFGIGRLIQVYSNTGKAAPIFVLVGIISTFGLVCVNALRALEARLAPWRGGR
jgi:NitT/TauT family transport system permease protein